MLSDEHSVPAERPESPGVLARSRRHVFHRGESGLVPVPAASEPGAETAILPRRNDGQRTNDVARNEDCTADSNAHGPGDAIP